MDLDVDVNNLRLERGSTAIKELLDLGAKKIVILGHRGRPASAKATAGKPATEFSLEPVKDRLEWLLNKAGVQTKINLARDINAPSASLGQLVMLENLRFWPGEKNNDPDFARQLSAWGEVYVNDAFGNSHRSDASMLGVAKILPAFAGPGLVNEITELSHFLENTPHPFVAVLGGAKIETKVPLIKRLLAMADTILVAGALANTILRSRGLEVGQSLVEESFLAEAKNLDNAKLVLPIDAIMPDSAVKAINTLDSQDFIGDIGPATVALFRQKIGGAKAILWNGPMGKFEDTKYQAGTNGILDAIVTSSAIKIAGGGDTLDIIEASRALNKFNFVSVGGGAMLTFLAGETMPALEALSVRHPELVEGSSV